VASGMVGAVVEAAGGLVEVEGQVYVEVAVVGGW